MAHGQRVLHTLGDAVADGCFGASVFAAVNVSLAVATVVLVWAGWTASLVSGMRGWRLVASKAVSAAFGLTMVALKKLLHA